MTQILQSNNISYTEWITITVDQTKSEDDKREASPNEAEKKKELSKEEEKLQQQEWEDESMRKR